MLKPYSRDSAYFQSLRDRNMVIAHRDLDSSFNDLVSYINDKLLPVVDLLANKQAVGVEGNEDAFLRNIGDGNTEFDRIRSNDLTDYSIALSKFATRDAYSVITSSNAQNLQNRTTNIADQVLVANNQLQPTWSKLSANNFADGLITSDKVGVASLTAQHLTPDIVGKPLVEGSIETQYIQDGTITLDKIADGAFTNNKISAGLLGTRAIAANLEYKDKCFTTRTIANNSVDIKNSFFYEVNAGFPITNLQAILSPSNIPLNAITIGKVDSPFTSIKFDVNAQFDGTILPSKVKDNSLSLPDIRNQFNGWVGITNNLKLGKKNLSPELKAILVNKGGLKP